MGPRRARLVAAIATTAALGIMVAGCTAGEPRRPPASDAVPAGSAPPSAPPSAGSGTTADDAPPSAPPSAGTGITAEDAQRRGVLTADLDARLDLPPGTEEGSVPGSADLRLVNVGAQDDRYELTVAPPSAGTVEPTAVRLEPSEVATVTVTLTEPRQSSVLRVVSLGRGGEIAALVLVD